MEESLLKSPAITRKMSNFMVLSRQESAPINDLKNKVTQQLKVYRVEKFTMREIQKKYYGIFWDGDSYVIKYIFTTAKGATNAVTYLWLGSCSSPDEVSTAAIKTTWESSGLPVIKRIEQGKETEHFLKLFNNRIIVLQGGIDSGFNALDEELQKMYPNLEINKDTASKSEVRNRLLRVKLDLCGEKMYTKVVEVACTAEMLNTNDSYILHTKDTTYAWKGTTCSERGIETALTIVEDLDIATLGLPPDDDRKLVVIDEDQEPAEFWESLGGKLEYQKDSLSSSPTPKFFQLSHVGDGFAAVKVPNFTQKDLMESGTALIDTGETIFVWLSERTSEDNKKYSLLSPEQYLKQSKDRDIADVKLVTVSQGLEPPYFTSCFPVWDYRMWNEGITYAERRRETLDEEKLPKLVSEALGKYNIVNYSYSELTSVKTPVWIDQTRKEAYLAEEEFERIFQMTRTDFNDMPEWKRIELKRKVGLF